MTNLKNGLLAGLLSLSLVLPVAVLPHNAYEQTSQSDHRQKTKNDWRNLAIGSGALALLGLINHDKTLTFVGASGALYSANRYEQDRKSQSKLRRSRAQVFSRSSFTQDGYLYTRHTKYKNDQKYYYFTRARI